MKRRSGHHGSKVPHSRRPEIHGAAHVVLRVCRGLPALRSPRVLERSFRRGKAKEGFRLVEFSVQRDHLHLIVEAEGKEKLARGMQGLTIRIAKGLNRLWRRRVGRVFAERYFALALTKRAQVWRTLRYVLNNGRKHGVWHAKDRPDPFSSGRWFRRWMSGDFRRPLRSPPTERSRTLDLYFLGLIQLDDMPGPRSFGSSETLEALLAQA